ncbi:MAG TPA: hypothetical protein VER33_19645 [Polyangiaceae bacterium]|nr:hypothetical protein [Polyangiaceae bacterium]
MVQLVPGGEHELSHLSDVELLASTRRLVGTSNKLFATLLLHLAEVEARGIHRQRACASLYSYCIYELRMSEDAAARRSSAARLVKAFPALLAAIAAGELHLTGVLMLGPHLTPENHVDVLARAKFRTKKELAKLVRELHPLPPVPDQMEALGPEPRRAASEPTWQEWLSSLGPPVRELPSEERPGTWADASVPSCGEEHAGSAVEGSTERSDHSLEEPDYHCSTDHSLEEPDDHCSTAHGLTAPARCELPPITAPQQYRMQFSTTEEHVRLVERARALLACTAPRCALGELHQQAMQLLVARLEKEKFAVSEPRPATRMGGSSPREQSAPATTASEPAWNKHDIPPAALEQRNRAPRQRGRHVPAGTKREVFLRDAGRCSYVDERGERCRETRYLELHHLQPFAQGGEHVATNVALRCAAHNALAAEEDYGRAVIERKRDSARHDSSRAAHRFESQLDPPTP